MIDDMAIRNMSPLTQKAYVRAVKNISLHFRRSPDVLTFEDVRAYQLHLVSRGLEGLHTAAAIRGQHVVPAAENLHKFRHHAASLDHLIGG